MLIINVSITAIIHSQTFSLDNKSKYSSKVGWRKSLYEETRGQQTSAVRWRSQEKEEVKGLTGWRSTRSEVLVLLQTLSASCTGFTLLPSSCAVAVLHSLCFPAFPPLIQLLVSRCPSFPSLTSHWLWFCFNSFVSSSLSFSQLRCL